MSLMIYKPGRTVVVDGVERTVSDHEQWYVENEHKDFHSRFGVIPKEKLVPGTVQLGNETFYVVPALFVDKLKSMKRKAQIITRKDAGFIAGWCGLTRDSVVVESGAGSGGATSSFAAIVKHVHTYEIDEDNLAVTKENIERLQFSNVTLTHADFYDQEKITAHEADLVLLDLPEPWRAFTSALKGAKLGGYVVAYTPSIVQAQKVVNGMPKELLHERTLELIDREWRIKDDAVRPMNTEVGHTAFLTFCRKIA